MIKVLILAIILVSLAFLGLAIRVLIIKGGRFSKSSCSSYPDGGKNKCACNAEGQEDETKCKYYSEHHPEKTR